MFWNRYTKRPQEPDPDLEDHIRDVAAHAGGGSGGGGGGGSAPDATSSTKGILRLTGALAGTADNPSVPGLASKSDTTHTHTDKSDVTHTHTDKSDTTHTHTNKADLSGGLVPNNELASSGATDGTTFLRSDRVWAVPPGTGGAGAVDQLDTYGILGLVSVQAGVLRWQPPLPCSVMGISAAINTAPVGAAIIFDANKNGATMYTTQANRPTIPAGANRAPETTPNVVAFNGTTDYMTIDVKQVGSPATPGSDTTVFIRYRWT